MSSKLSGWVAYFRVNENLFENWYLNAIPRWNYTNYFLKGFRCTLNFILHDIHSCDELLVNIFSIEFVGVHTVLLVLKCIQKG